MHDDCFPPGFFIGGFECSTHRRSDRARIDVSRGTAHDIHVAQDYAACRAIGIDTVRDGLRWHLIEGEAGHYDWSSWRPMLAAADHTGTTVIWDLWHYGTPEFVDIWSLDFVERLAAFARAAALIFREHSDAVPWWCPLNEMSFFSFIAGDAGAFEPYAIGRGFELKCQLARAAIAVAAVLRDVDPRARLLWAEPSIAIHPPSYQDRDIGLAMGAHLAQYQAYDMISGRFLPELGGHPDLLDLIGLNYYPANQWVWGGSTVPFGSHAYRPLAELIAETSTRYGRPMILAETGAEGSARRAWFGYICDEVFDARAAGHPIGGVCLYPVTNYPGWDDDRICATGLFGEADASGTRAIYRPLADELRRQQDRLSSSPKPGATV